MYSYKPVDRRHSIDDGYLIMKTDEDGDTYCVGVADTETQAQLWIVAQDLLAALEAMLADISPRGINYVYPDPDVRKAALAAVARAKGEV